MSRVVGTVAVLLVACDKASDDADDNGDGDGLSVPRIEDLTEVVPGSGLPPEVVSQTAHNNLDIERHDGRLFLAFRTAPTHFASPDTVMYVVSTTDEETWGYEGSFALGTDVREPQLVSWDGRLLLYFAVLGDDPLDFEPQGAVWTEYLGPGSWTDLTDYPDPSFIPWRIKVVEGRLYLIGYTGGAGIYDEDAEPIEVHWLTSEDGTSWEPVIADQPVVHTGGASETDFALLDDGSLVAVMRNEAGDEDGFGSKICRAEADSLGAWSCVPDVRKFDSPLVIDDGDAIWLVARKTETEDGAYDLGHDELDAWDQSLEYQVTYWNAPKRCAVWKVDPVAQAVTWAMDLPSRGDTCFPEAVPMEEEGRYLLYNYSSDVDGPDLTWLEGQLAPTSVYRQELVLR